MHKLTLSFSAARAVFSGLSAHKLLYSSHTKQESLRKYTQDQTKRQLNCYRLQHRTLINVTGNETTSFLQGIITNDASLLEEQEEGVKAMYAQMLNVQGRTLYDIIIYSLKDSQSGLQGVLLECDGSVQESVIKHLKMYKIRRKVNVSSTGLLVWALLPQNKDVLKTFKPDVTVAENVLVLVQDPRTELMGWRLITSHDVNPVEIISACRQGNTEEYHRHRYEIGLPEGVKDLPPGEALPLESNLVYMQGISFTKGCYIGQELTARTHFTGVVRKRLMPVSLSAPVENVNQGAALETEEGKPAGKHRAGIGQLGLSLVRTAHAKEPLKLKLSDNTTVTLQATVPEWWPKNTKDK